MPLLRLGRCRLFYSVAKSSSWNVNLRHEGKWETYGNMLPKVARIHNRPLLPARLRLGTLYEFFGACQSGRLKASEISEVV